MRRRIRPIARDIRTLLVLVVVAALVASAGWAQDRQRRDRVTVKFFVLKDGRLGISGNAGAGEVVTVESSQDGQVCSVPTQGARGLWNCWADVRGNVFHVSSTGGGSTTARDRGARYLPKWVQEERRTPLRRWRPSTNLQIGRAVLKRGRLSIRGRDGRGNTITVTTGAGRMLCSVAVGRSRVWRCSERGVSPGTFVVRSSSGASATITR